VAVDCEGSQATGDVPVEPFKSDKDVAVIYQEVEYDNESAKLMYTSIAETSEGGKK